MTLKKIIPFLAILLFSCFSFSQQKFTLSGTIIDANSNETLIGVNVVLPELKTGLMNMDFILLLYRREPTRYK